MASFADENDGLASTGWARPAVLANENNIASVWGLVDKMGWVLRDARYFLMRRCIDTFMMLM
jgi:hypothetical protein